ARASIIPLAGTEFPFGHLPVILGAALRSAFAFPNLVGSAADQFFKLPFHFCYLLLSGIIRYSRQMCRPRAMFRARCIDSVNRDEKSAFRRRGDALKRDAEVLIKDRIIDVLDQLADSLSHQGNRETFARTPVGAVHVAAALRNEGVAFLAPRKPALGPKFFRAPKEPWVAGGAIEVEKHPITAPEAIAFPVVVLFESSAHDWKEGVEAADFLGKSVVVGIRATAKTGALLGMLVKRESRENDEAPNGYDGAQYIDQFHCG